MATAEEYGQWIVDNADKKGTADFEKVAEAFRVSRAASAPAPKPQNLQRPLADDIRQVISEESSPLGAKVIGGMGVGLDEAALRLKQFGPGLNAADQNQVQADRQFGDAAGVPGAVGKALPLLLPAARLAQAGTAALSPFVSRWMASLTGAGAAGAAQNVGTNPVLPGESEAANAGAGFAGGALGDRAAAGVGRLMQPITQSAPVQRLIQQGIIPTAGQALGGAWKTAESKLTSMPFLGDVIRWGANRPVQETNLAALRSVSPQVTEIGSEGLRQAQKIADDAYNAVTSRFSVVPDARFVGMTSRIERDASYSLSEEQRGSFRDFVQQKIIEPLRRQPQVAPGPPSSRGFPASPQSGPAITQKGSAVVDPRAPEVLGPEARILDQTGKPFVAPGGQQAAPIVSGEIFKKIDSELGAKASNLRKSGSASERDLGEAFFRLQHEWRDLLERGAPPGVAQEMEAANRMWANLTIVERAAAKTKTGDGEFTTAQLQQAVREADPSIRKRAFAGGNARMQGLSNPAVNVVGGGYADSGTAGRNILAHTVLGVAGGAGGYMTGNPKEGAIAGAAIPLALAAMASPLYSRAGARYLVGDLLPYGLQQGGANAMRQGAPYASGLGASLMDYARGK